LRNVSRRSPAPRGRPLRAAPPLAPAAEPADARPTSGTIALERILYAPKGRDGGRHLNIGRTGSGKSYLTRAVLAELRGRCKWIFTLDDKDADETDYTGLQYVDAQAFREVPPQKLDGQPLERRIIFRGDAYEGIKCEAEDVAALSLDMARSGIPVCLNLDEGKRAAAGKNGQTWTAPTVPVLITEGRSLGVWVVASWQSAKRVPDEMLQEASSVAVFRQKARAANYLVEVLDMDDRLEDVVRTLPDTHFVLLSSEEEWDGRTYRL
jgi:hypothetical protein